MGKVCKPLEVTVPGNSGERQGKMLERKGGSVEASQDEWDRPALLRPGLWFLYLFYPQPRPILQGQVQKQDEGGRGALASEARWAGAEGGRGQLPALLVKRLRACT